MTRSASPSVRRRLRSLPIVYFSCLEALQNAGKYAEATKANVRLTGGAGALAFHVVDDGCGFDPTMTG